MQCSRHHYLPSLIAVISIGRCTRRSLPKFVRQIRDQLLAGGKEFAFVHDVVPVEHCARFVTGKRHRDPLRDAGSNQISRRGAAAVVQEALGQLCGLERIRPCAAPGAYGDVVSVEYPRTAFTPLLRSAIEHLA